MAIVTIDNIPVYQALIGGDDCGMMRISLVDDPAVQSDFMAFAEQKPVQMFSVQDEEKRLVLGCVMRADFPIYRRDGDFEYYIIYRAETIRAMAEKYLAENRQNLVNLMHEEGTDVDGVQMVQYFIKGAGLQPEGFDGIADGSLFAEFHVTNDEVWASIKEGTYRGFSLEGVFDLVPERDRPYVAEAVDELDGMFSRIKNDKSTDKMAKLKGLMARIARALAEMASMTTDRGILAWDGDDELAEGVTVYIEDEDGARTPAADGEYVAEDGRTIVVSGGAVAEIREAAAPEEPAEETAETAEAEEVKGGSVATDKGALAWDGDEDLKAGDSVYREDGEPAEDGEYVTEDGKTIVVVDGKVSEIKDAAAEVAPEVDGQAEALEQVTAERDEALARAEALEAKVAELSARVAELSAKPQGQPAHVEHERALPETGNKGLDRLARIAAAR